MSNWLNLRRRSSALRLCPGGGCLALTLHECCEEDDSEHEAEGSDDDVTNCKEIVATTHNVGCGQHETLGSIEGAHVVESFAECIH